MVIAETSRLLVRSWALSDAEHWLRMAKDVGYNCFIPPGFFLVKDAGDAQERIRQRMEVFDKRGTGKFVVLDKNTGDFVGTCGVDPYLLNGRETHELGHCAAPGCTSQRWLEIHHIVPVSQGGRDEISNLTTLCHAHHKQRHGPHRG